MVEGLTGGFAVSTNDARPNISVDLLADVDANVFAVGVFSCWALDLTLQDKKPW